MRYRRLKVGLAIVGSLGAALTLVAQPAFADYAPTQKDVVGVGSDTLQYMLDFVADGDYVSDTGFNSAAPKFHIVNFDATADANARLAYGPAGVGPTGTGAVCPPGNGVGTGTGSNPGTVGPCILNPTIVLRAGQRPVQRPNGSGAGAKALAGDTSHFITYIRASACEGPTTGCPGTLNNTFDSVQLGTDPLAMLVTNSTHAVALSAAQLNLIYSCSGGSGPNGSLTWNDPRIGGTSTDPIIPIIPQVGSGTRSFFLGQIGNPTVGPCVVTGEENDPTALSAQSSPNDAIEPMSGGRLNLFQGVIGSPVGGTSGTGGYFQDPTCPIQAIEAGSGNCASPANQINPAVHLQTTGTPGGSVGGSLFDVSRPLYVYFRDSDLNSTAVWQPGGTLNQIKTVFWNPTGTSFVCSAAGQALIAAAGVNATCNFTPGGP